jgi:hypothetical protein
MTPQSVCGLVLSWSEPQREQLVMLLASAGILHQSGWVRRGEATAKARTVRCAQYDCRNVAIHELVGDKLPATLEAWRNVAARLVVDHPQMTRAGPRRLRSCFLRWLAREPRMRQFASNPTSR